jgi:hypothetical protein
VGIVLTQLRWLRQLRNPSKLDPGIAWILGYDLQLEAPNALQRSIRFLDHWDDRRALEFGAIHLCSTQCLDEYLRTSKVVKNSSAR